MRCKNKKVFIIFHSHEKHPVMVELLWWLEGQVELVLTSSFRKDKIHPKDSGIHCVLPIRAIDLRSWIFKNPQRIEKLINDNWIYDPKRPNIPVAYLHDTGQGVHFHTQVHDRTIRRQNV